jgi:outer membrane protein OmpA-like peptidoglycan-associated protein
MRIVVFFIVAMLSLPALAFRYVSALENSTWESKVSRFECSLTHPVEGFGAGKFYHAAGGQRAFILEARGFTLAAEGISLVADPPNWLPGKAPRLIAKLETASKPLQLDAELATQMMAELLNGMMVGLKGTLRDSRDEPFEVLLSTAGFLHQYESFLVCENKLLPMGFDQLERARIQYVSNEFDISAAGLQLLKDMGEYLQADSNVKSIYIDGHTDDAGSAKDNIDKSEQRARLVADYLIGLGVAEDKLVVRYHGEQYPVVRNSSAANRAMNRRTTIRLSLAPPIRPEPAPAPPPATNSKPAAPAETEPQASQTASPKNSRDAAGAVRQIVGNSRPRTGKPSA